MMGHGLNTGIVLQMVPASQPQPHAVMSNPQAVQQVPHRNLMHQALNNQQPALAHFSLGIANQGQTIDWMSGFRKESKSDVPSGSGMGAFDARGSLLQATEPSDVIKAGTVASTTGAGPAASDPLLEAVRFCAQSRKQVLQSLRAKEMQLLQTVQCAKCGLPLHRHCCPFTEETPATPVFTSSRAFTAHLPQARRLGNPTHTHNRAASMKPGRCRIQATSTFKPVIRQQDRLRKAKPVVLAQRSPTSTGDARAATSLNNSTTQLLQLATGVVNKPLLQRLLLDRISNSELTSLNSPNPPLQIGQPKSWKAPEPQGNRVLPGAGIQTTAGAGMQTRGFDLSCSSGFLQGLGGEGLAQSLFKSGPEPMAFRPIEIGYGSMPPIPFVA